MPHPDTIEIVLAPPSTFELVDQRFYLVQTSESKHGLAIMRYWKDSVIPDRNGGWGGGFAADGITIPASQVQRIFPLPLTEPPF